MKKIYILIGALAITSANFAQEQFTGKVVATSMGSAPAAISSPVKRVSALNPTDTINWNPDTSGDIIPVFGASGGLTRYGYLGGGYIFGNNVDGLNTCAAGFVNLNAQTITIDKVIFSAYAKKQTSTSGNSKIKVGIYTMSPNKAYNETAPSATTSAQNSEGPDVALSFTTVPFANIDTTTRPIEMGNHFTVATFSTPVTVSGNFAVSVDSRTIAATGTANGDTLGILADSDDATNTLDMTFHFYGTRWYVTDYLFGDLKTNIAIFPVVGITTAVKEFFNGVKLNAIYPNPSKDVATISYSLEKNSTNVSLTIIDINGKLIHKEGMGDQQAGSYSVNLNTSSYASGSYFYQLHANGQVVTKEFVVTK